MYGRSRTGAPVRGPGLRQLTCDTCSSLLASYLGQRWRDQLGDDHEHLRAIARLLDRTLRAIGRYAEARKLAQDTLDRDRRIPGEDHPETLISATSLTIDLRYLGKTETAQISDGNQRGSRHSCRRLSYRAADFGRGSTRAISRANVDILRATPTDVEPLFGLLKRLTSPVEPYRATPGR